MAVAHVFARLTGGTGADGMKVDKQGRLFAAHYRAGEVLVFDPNGFPYGTIRLPADAGMKTTNFAFKGDYLYITEAQNNKVWRVKLKTNAK